MVYNKTHGYLVFMSISVDNAGFYSATAVANYIVSHASSVTNLKLQKMLYFIQGFALVQLGRALFTDYIEAWTYGPVVPSVYQRFKKWGADPIRQVEPAETIDNPAVIDFLNRLIRVLDGFSALDLVELTHKEGSPWSMVWNKGYGRYCIIPNEMIRQYFMRSISA